MYITWMILHPQKAQSGCTNAGLLISLLLFIGSSAAVAQAQRPGMQRFEDGAPQIGELLPDITVHDDLGNPVNIRELANENYKVLVLGCLT